MNVEQQLRSLDMPNDLLGDWGDVVARADRRSSHRQLQGRVAIAMFVIVVGIGALVVPGIVVETVELPGNVAQPAINDVSTVEVSRSTFHLLAVVLLTLGVSFAIAALSFFAAPRYLRAPFSPTRTARLSGALLRGAAWAGALSAISGFVLLILDNTFVRDIHAHGGWVFLSGLAGAALLLTTQTKGMWSSTWMFIAFFVGAQASVLMLVGSGRNLATSGWTDALVHLGLAALLGWVAWRSLTQIDAPTTRGRISRDALRTLSWRQVTAAVLMLGGLTFAAISIAPALLLHGELHDVLPEVDGYERRIDSFTANPLWDSNGSDPIRVSYQRIGVERSDVRFDAQIPVNELLQPLRFTPATQTFDTNGQSFEAPAIFWRTRADKYEATVVTSQSDQFASNLTVSVANTEPIEDALLLMRLGVAAALSGLIFLWSQTAISRYAVGNFSVPRQSRGREQLGWIVIIASIAIAVGAVVLSRMNLWGMFAVIGIGWYVGAKLLVPNVRKHAMSARAEAASNASSPDKD